MQDRSIFPIRLKAESELQGMSLLLWMGDKDQGGLRQNANDESEIKDIV